MEKKQKHQVVVSLILCLEWFHLNGKLRMLYRLFKSEFQAVNDLFSVFSSGTSRVSLLIVSCNPFEIMVLCSVLIG